MRSILIKFYFAMTAVTIVAPSYAVEIAKKIPSELESVKIEEKLGDKIDIANLKFTDENGEKVLLSKYFSGSKPVLLAMVYYECPNLCTFLLNGTVNSIRPLKQTAGKDFEVIAVSVNPKETPDLALAKKKAYLKEYGRLEGPSGFHFLTGEEPQIQNLAAQLGFHYYYDKESKQYAHSSALFVLTSTGKISRILYGIDFANRDMKLALLEASDGKVGTILDRILMFCYKYDPHARGYSIYAMRLVRASSALMIFILGFVILFYLRRERRALR